MFTMQPVGNKGMGNNEGKDFKYILEYIIFQCDDKQSFGKGIHSSHETLYIITYSMEQSPSSEANQFSASQEIPLILWNQNGHYRVYKSHLSLF
jgi:hypothetical protein